jgi:hypothetical protein
MAKKHESKWNIEELTVADVYDAIRYLDSDPVCRKQQKLDTAFIICAAVIILLSGCVGLMWLLWK